MPRAEITDLFRVDDLLSPEEKAARDSVAAFIDREYLPIVGKHFRDGTFPMHLVPKLGELGVFGANLARLRLPGAEQRHLRADPPGARARRLGAALLRVGAGLALHVPDPRVRERGAEAALPPEDGQGRADRLLRPHRARRGERPGVDAHPRPQGRRPLRPQRHQDVDHERHPRRRGGGLGEGRRRRRRVDARLPRREGDARLQRAGDPGEVLAPGLVDRRALVPGRAGAGGERAAGGDRAEGPALVPEQGARGDRVRGAPARRSRASRARGSTRSRASSSTSRSPRSSSPRRSSPTCSRRS